MPIFAVFFTCRLTVNLKTRRSLTLPLCLHPSTSQSKLVPLQPCPAAQCGKDNLKMRRIINSHVCKLGKPCTMVQSGCGYVDPSYGKLWANIATATLCTIVQSFPNLQTCRTDADRPPAINHRMLPPIPSESDRTAIRQRGWGGAAAPKIPRCVERERLVSAPLSEPWSSSCGKCSSTSLRVYRNAVSCAANTCCLGFERNKSAASTGSSIVSPPCYPVL